jgi:hypothetical protein
MNQGEIHYDVQYEGHVTLMPKELMPKNLVVSFKDDNIIYELISPFGNSGITNLSNPSKEIYDTYISLRFKTRRTLSWIRCYARYGNQKNIKV